MGGGWFAIGQEHAAYRGPCGGGAGHCCHDAYRRTLWVFGNAGGRTIHRLVRVGGSRCRALAWPDCECRAVRPAHVERIERIRLKLKDQLDAIEATPFLHDTTTKNVIVTTEGKFSGIVDVDDLCYGDPRFVTALTEVALRANGLPATYSNYLMEASGWMDDHLNRLYVAVIFLGFMSEHGQPYNGNQRPSQPEARAKLLALYEDALRDL